MLSIKLKGAALLISMAVCSSAFGDARVARIPQSITQHYETGDSSRLECPLGFRSEGSPQCHLTIKEDRRQFVVNLDLPAAGYTLMTQQYQIFGRVQDGDFGFSLVVDCNDEDYKVVAQEVAECRLFFFLREKQLIPDRVVITHQQDGKVIEALRPIN